MTDPTVDPSADAAWRDRLAKTCADDAKAHAKTRRPHREFTPISRDWPTSARTRLRAVEWAVALHVQGGCNSCGKPSPLDADDCCRCGSSPEQWRAYCLSRISDDGYRAHLERSGWA